MAQSHYHSGLMMRKTKSQPERKKIKEGETKVKDNPGEKALTIKKISVPLINI